MDMLLDGAAFMSEKSSKERFSDAALLGCDSFGKLDSLAMLGCDSFGKLDSLAILGCDSF